MVNIKAKKSGKFFADCRVSLNEMRGSGVLRKEGLGLVEVTVTDQLVVVYEVSNLLVLEAVDQMHQSLR